MEQVASHRAPRTGWSRRRKALAGVLAAVMALVVGVGAYLVYLDSQLASNVKREDLLSKNVTSTSTSTIRVVDGVLVNELGEKFVDANGNPITVSTTEIGDQPERLPSQGESLNILLVGVDEPSRDDQTTRSDAIILMHVSSDRSRIDLLHVPRDLYVTIPGVGQDKVNAAYQVGGMPLLAQTLQPMLGVPIDHAAQVDFAGFSQMVDAIGGVELPVAGKKTEMNGTQALDWVRERKTLQQGDISRGERQMYFLKVVINRALSPAVLLNPTSLSEFVSAVASAVTVDNGMTTDRVRSLLFSLRDLRSNDIFARSYPWQGYGFAGRASIVVPAPEQQAVLAKALQNDAMAGYVDKVSPKATKPAF